MEPEDEIRQEAHRRRMILAEGMDLISVQKILGHRSLAMLQQHYSHVTETEAGRKLMAVLIAEEQNEWARADYVLSRSRA